MPGVALVKIGAAARRALGIIERAQKARLPLDEDERLALVPGMVAERHAIGPVCEQLVADHFRDAEPAGGILAVDDDEIGPQACTDIRQMPLDGRAPGAADDIADKQKAHRDQPGSKDSVRVSVITASRRWSCGSRGTVSISWRS